MTKKDYELIASWANYCQGTALDMHALLILAAKLQAHNKLFNRSKFLKACGLEV